MEKETTNLPESRDFVLVREDKDGLKTFRYDSQHRVIVDEDKH